MGLCAGGVTRGRDPPGQRVDRRPDDAFRAQPVAGHLQQQCGRVVFQRAGEQELIELFPLAGGAPAPAEPGQHLRPVCTAGFSPPTAVGPQQAGRLTRGDRQRGGQAVQRRSRARTQIVRDPAQPRQRA